MVPYRKQWNFLTTTVMGLHVYYRYLLSKKNFNTILKTMILYPKLCNFDHGKKLCNFDLLWKNYGTIPKTMVDNKL